MHSPAPWIQRNLRCPKLDKYPSSSHPGHIAPQSAAGLPRLCCCCCSGGGIAAYVTKSLLVEVFQVGSVTRHLSPLACSKMSWMESGLMFTSDGMKVSSRVLLQKYCQHLQENVAFSSILQSWKPSEHRGFKNVQNQHRVKPGQSKASSPWRKSQIMSIEVREVLSYKVQIKCQVLGNKSHVLSRQVSSPVQQSPNSVREDKSEIGSNQVKGPFQRTNQVSSPTKPKLSRTSHVQSSLKSCPAKSKSSLKSLRRTSPMSKSSP